MKFIVLITVKVKKKFIINKILKQIKPRFIKIYTYFSFLDSHNNTTGDRVDFETPNSSLHSPVAQQQPAETASATSHLEQKTEHKFRQGFSNHIR